MNYYEELGISRSASLVEIRQAYKALVRVVHPDHQQDETLKRLSELQLRRLNHILQVLSNPVKRREYDWSLDRLLPAPNRRAPPQKVPLSMFRGVRITMKPGTLVWFLMAAIAICSLVYWIRTPQPIEVEALLASMEKPVDPS